MKIRKRSDFFWFIVLLLQGKKLLKKLRFYCFSPIYIRRFVVVELKYLIVNSKRILQGANRVAIL